MLSFELLWDSSKYKRLKSDVNTGPASFCPLKQKNHKPSGLFKSRNVPLPTFMVLGVCRRTRPDLAEFRGDELATTASHRRTLF